MNKHKFYRVSTFKDEKLTIRINKKFIKRLLLAGTLALILACIDLFVVNLSVYFMSFWVAWTVIK